MRDDERATTLVDTIWGHKTVTLPLAVCGTNFQVQVWRALLELDATASRSHTARWHGDSECRMARVLWVMQ